MSLGPEAEISFDEWVSRERDFVLHHRGLAHPFFEQLDRVCGDFSLLSEALKQVYHLVLGFPFHIAAAIGNSRDENLLRILVHNLFAEVGEFHGETHINIYRRLLRAVGEGTERPPRNELWPESLTLEALCSCLYKSSDIGTKLGSLFAFEVMSSPMVRNWSESLERVSGLKDEDYAFFTVHIDIEAEHADDIIYCCQAYYPSPTFEANFRAASSQIMAGLESFWDRMGALVQKPHAATDLA